MLKITSEAQESARVSGDDDKKSARLTPNCIILTGVVVELTHTQTQTQNTNKISHISSV